jgi:transcriptional regulator with GAF, ATPase, and Fis domain
VQVRELDFAACFRGTRPALCRSALKIKRVASSNEEVTLQTTDYFFYKKIDGGNYIRARGVGEPDGTTVRFSLSIVGLQLNRVTAEADYQQTVARPEAHISAVLRQTHGVIESANGGVKTLGMHLNTLRHRMEKLGIKRSAPPHIVARPPKANLSTTKYRTRFL